MREEAGTPDAAVARIAARQHGVVTAGQLAASGIGKDGAYRRARSGRLHRVHRGVYAVGHPGLGNEGRWMAAVLACGEGAALSHRSAAELWDLLSPRPGAVDVTVPRGRDRRAGIRLHRSPLLTSDATTLRNGIAVTTPARTLADLRRAVSAETLRKAIREASSAASTSATRRATTPAASSSVPSCGSAAAIACRRRRSTPASAALRSTSSGAESGWSSRPTATPLTVAARRSRTITRANSSCRCSATGCAGSPTDQVRRRPRTVAGAVASALRG